MSAHTTFVDDLMIGGGDGYSVTGRTSVPGCSAHLVTILAQRNMGEKSRFSTYVGIEHMFVTSNVLLIDGIAPCLSIPLLGCRLVLRPVSRL